MSAPRPPHAAPPAASADPCALQPSPLHPCHVLPVSPLCCPSSSWPALWRGRQGRRRHRGVCRGPRRSAPRSAPGLILHTPHPAPRATRDNPADPAAREAGRLPGTRVHRSQRGCRRAAGAHVPRDAIRALWGSPLLSSGGSRLSLPCSPQPRSAVAQLSSWPRGAAPLPTCPLPDPKFLQHPAAHETSALGNQSASQGNLILSSFEVWPSARFTLCD